jgi:hypothetical protein
MRLMLIVLWRSSRWLCLSKPTRVTALRRTTRTVLDVLLDDKVLMGARDLFQPPAGNDVTVSRTPPQFNVIVARAHYRTTSSPVGTWSLCDDSQLLVCASPATSYIYQRQSRSSRNVLASISLDRFPSLLVVGGNQERETPTPRRRV